MPRMSSFAMMLSSVARVKMELRISFNYLLATLSQQKQTWRIRWHVRWYRPSLLSFRFLWIRCPRNRARILGATANSFYTPTHFYVKSS